MQTRNRARISAFDAHMALVAESKARRLGRQAPPAYADQHKVANWLFVIVAVVGLLVGAL